MFPTHVCRLFGEQPLGGAALGIGLTAGGGRIIAGAGGAIIAAASADFPESRLSCESFITVCFCRPGRRDFFPRAKSFR